MHGASAVMSSSFGKESQRYSPKKERLLSKVNLISYNIMLYRHYPEGFFIQQVGTVLFSEPCMSPSFTCYVALNWKHSRKYLERHPKASSIQRMDTMPVMIQRVRGRFFQAYGHDITTHLLINSRIKARKKT